MHFEVPVFSAAAATAAAARGATRLEINRAGSYAAGGLTPSLAEVAAVRQATNTPVRIMIRPRGPLASGDFIYSEAEFTEMLDSITEFVKSGLLRAQDGFVFGVLEDKDKLQLDQEKTRLLIEKAAGHDCILHRAFDLVVDAADPAASLQTVQSIGFAGVLTAGGPHGGAIEHVDTLRKLVSSTEIEVIVGGGVRSGNMSILSGILDGVSTPRVAFHSSCLLDAAAAVRDGAAGEVVDGAEAGQISSIVSLL